MRLPARPAALITILFATACAHDAPGVTEPWQDEVEPVIAEKAMDRSEMPLETIRVMVDDVSDRLLPALDAESAALLQGPLDDLSAALAGGHSAEVRRALARAHGTLARLLGQGDLREGSEADLQAIRLTFADAASPWSD